VRAAPAEPHELGWYRRSIKEWRRLERRSRKHANDIIGSKSFCGTPGSKLKALDANALIQRLDYLQHILLLLQCIDTGSEIIQDTTTGRSKVDISTT
jgi:hypothetical protein